MRGEARRRFDGVVGEPRNSYKGISKILSLSLSLSLPPCSTDLACRTLQRGRVLPSFSRIREHTKTLNKTERKRETRGEKPELELIENARVSSHSIDRHGWTVARSSRPPRPFEFTSFPSLTSKGTHHPVIKGADNAKLSLESFLLGVDPKCFFSSSSPSILEDREEAKRYNNLG